MNSISQPFNHHSYNASGDGRPYALEFMTGANGMGWIHEEFLSNLIDDLHQLGFTNKDVTDLEIEANVIYPRQGGEQCLLTIPITLWAYPVGNEMRLYDLNDLPRWQLHTDATDTWGEQAIVRLR